MGAYKDKIVKELLKNKQYDLADMIDTIESDVDVANYISSNRGYFTKAYTTPDLELMPEFRKALYTDIKTGQIDYDKEFGNDWYKNFEEIPSDQIKFVADKQGKTYNETVNEMGKLATEKRRHDIAHDGTIPGYITEMMLPRSIEAVERGETPGGEDIGLDLGQNVLYATPWGRFSAPLARLGFLGRIGQGVAGNVATPTIMEAADAAAYGDDNPRGNFSGTDVATESAVNATMPWVIRGMAMGAGRFTTGKGRDLANKFMELGTNRTSRNDMPNVLRNDVKTESRNAAKHYIRQNMPESRGLKEGIEYETYKSNKDANEMRNRILNKLDLYYNGYNGKKIPAYKLNLNADEKVFMRNDPILSKYIDIEEGFKNLPTASQLRAEEEIKNYLTNNAGTYWYDEQSPWTRIPVAGSRIDRYMKEEAKQDSARAVKDSIIKEILNKYGEPRGL